MIPIYCSGLRIYVSIDAHRNEQNLSSILEKLRAAIIIKKV